MQNLIKYLTIFTVLLFLSTPALAEEKPMVNKFKRGAINVLTRVFEVPKQIKAEYKTAGESAPEKVATAIGGTFKGFAYFIGRLSSGVYDMVTMNINWPKGYEPLIKPDYVKEEWNN